MAGTKISALTAASAFDGSEIFPLVQSAGNVKATLDEIAAYIVTRHFMMLQADYTLTSTTSARRSQT